jgi:sigma-B regulation protein RsbU (phosphoserine phosphatase)
LAAALILTLATAAYAGIWIYYIRLLPQNVIGVAFRPFSAERKSLDLVWVARKSAAERAGLTAGDRIVAIDRHPMVSLEGWVDLVLHATPGSTVVFTVATNAGSIHDCPVSIPILPPELVHPTLLQSAVMRSLLSYPLFFLVVGAVVLFLRLEDGNAWLLALMFAGFVGLASWVTPEAEPLVPLSIRRFALTWHLGCQEFLPALFYWFFAVFPVPSPLERKVPWLKWTLLAMASVFAFPVIARVAVTGSYASVLETAAGSQSGAAVARGCGIGAIVLGLVSLIWNGLRAPTAEARRKVRVLVIGTAVGVAPLLVFSAAFIRSDTGANPIDLPFYAWVGGVVGIILVPLSFAYAVFKHRVMEIPVLLKRSARYVLVKRGFAAFIITASVVAAWAAVEFFSGFFTGLFGSGPQVILSAGMAATGFGGALALAGARVQRGVRDRLDQAFFRGAYDARQILEDLAQRIRGAQSCDEVASLLEKQVCEALHPALLAVYIESSEGCLRTEAQSVPASLRTLAKNLPALEEIASRGRPFDVPPPGSGRSPEFSILDPLNPECIVPMSARGGRLVGAIILAQRLSEEPYSSDDKRLLASVANQSGLAIDSIRLAEAMAQRLENERRAAQELEMAKVVQTRLLLQRARHPNTLEYAGRCVQARAVGGDYYDFLDLGENRIVLALADVSGKGLPAALLMASVQAILRTHCADSHWDLGTVMRQMNRLLYESTAPEHFVTMFVGDYNDANRRLHYVNCGHNPPIVLKREGEVLWLDSTACVLGAFRQWDCSVEGITLEPGDLIALYTDGISEASNGQDEEFGAERLTASLRQHRNEPLGAALDAVILSVQEFAGGNQADDLTLILARGM